MIGMFPCDSFTVGQPPEKGVPVEIYSLFKLKNLNMVSSLVTVNLIHLGAD